MRSSLRRTRWLWLHWQYASLLAVLLWVMPMLASAQFTSRTMQQRNKAQSGSFDEHIRKLNNADPDVRFEAVRQLANSRDKKAVEYLIQSVGDPDVRVRAKAIEALGEMRAADATQVLVQQLFLRTSEPALKQRILAALGKIGDPRAARPLLEFLQLDLDLATKGTAIYALGEIGSVEALDVLQQLANTEQDPTLRRLAQEATAKIEYYQSSKAREAKGPTDTFLPKPPRQQPQ
ncbi:MAG: HEAT repeat domain-containing protein [Candidatus Binatia bacterium]|nr:HEAT repeat domain-containing protein [Candidatus Binatia bacterium]